MRKETGRKGDEDCRNLKSCDYSDKFEKPKIFWPEIAGSARFTLMLLVTVLITKRIYLITVYDLYPLEIINPGCYDYSFVA
jgi:hypothetical protein